MIILFTSCSSITTRNNFEIRDNMSIEEFRLKLIEYSNTNPYPNIND